MNPKYSHLKLASYKNIVIWTVILYFWIKTDNNYKLRGLFISLFYSLIEFTWTGTSYQDEKGETVWSPFDKRCKAHTV